MLRTSIFRTFTFASILLSAIAFNGWSGNEITNVRVNSDGAVLYRQYGVESMIDMEKIGGKTKYDSLGVLYILKNVVDLRAAGKLMQHEVEFGDTALVISYLISRSCNIYKRLDGNSDVEVERFIDWILIPNLNNQNNLKELLGWKLFSNLQEDVGFYLSRVWKEFCKYLLQRKDINMTSKIHVLESPVTDEEGKKFTFIESVFDYDPSEVVKWLKTLNEADLNAVLNVKFLSGGTTLKDAIKREGYKLENIR